MFVDRYPSFSKGRILKTEMLDNLRDYPRQMLDIYYSGYSDGILAGTDVLVSGNVLKISRGMVKHGGRLYWLEQDYELPYEATGRETAIKIRFQQASTTRSDITSHDSEIVLDSQLACASNELELGRFKLKSGARLRMDYESFRDMTTEYNTLHFTFVRYSAYGQSTLAPILLRRYAEELLRSGSSDPHDISFAMLCLNEGTVALPVIEHYIAARLGADRRQQSADHGQLYTSLRRILDIAGSGGRGPAKPDFRQGGMQRVLVD